MPNSYSLQGTWGSEMSSSLFNITKLATGCVWAWFWLQNPGSVCCTVSHGGLPVISQVLICKWYCIYPSIYKYLGAWRIAAEGLFAGGLRSKFCIMAKRLRARDTLLGPQTFLARHRRRSEFQGARCGPLTLHSSRESLCRMWCLLCSRLCSRYFTHKY